MKNNLLKINRVANEIINPKLTGITFQGAKPFGDIPAGEYKAVVVGIYVENHFKKKTLRFVYRVIEGEFKDEELNGFISANYETFSNHTKLAKTWQVLTGERVDENTQINIDLFYNKILLVKVERKTTKKSNEISNVKQIIGVLGEI